MVAGAGPVVAARSAAMAVSATVLAAAVVVVCVLPFALGDPNAPQVQRLPAWYIVVVAVAATISVAAAWAARSHDGHASAALALAGVAAVLPLWASQEWLPGSLRAATLATTPLAVAAIAATALLWPAGAEPRADRLVMVIAGIAVVAAGVHVLAYNPFADPGCAQTCANLSPPLGELVGTRATVAITTVAIVSIALIGGVAVAATLRTRSSRLVSGAALAALTALGGLAVLRWLTFENLTPSAVRLPLEPLGVAAVGAAVCLLHLRVLRTRSAVDRVVAGLSAESVRRGAVVDVQFAVPGEDRWLDPAGVAVLNSPEPARTVVLTDGSAPTVRLVAARAVDPAEILAGLSPVTRLALHNAQLSTVARARLAEVRASQRRVVAASDSERRRIERDLHDGAQQRLVGVGLQLRIARADADQETRLTIARLESKVGDALSQLRRLAHGVFPSVLADEGLEQALVELVAASDVPAALTVQVSDALTTEVAMAAYATVAAAVGGVVQPSTATCCRIEVGQLTESLIVRVETESATFLATDLTAIGDRVGAVGGQLTWSGPEAGRYDVTAVIPCVS
ncbi:sensor histidine kinase [Kribbella kalugense]|uniref:histidine kinase n=1 Tax=Kribbella kalugense TaxID=2512221 RepID=A0A4R7ZAK0_9ACTN|nr:histidine kinase [Kribbella kalugense]TDW14449.1 histidine kinase [Kribbella kalugense]